MINKTKLIVFGLYIILSGCENGNFTPTEESRAIEKAITAKRGEARIKLFNECMELAAKMPRQADDDVADIVQECSSQSYHMSVYING